MLDVDVVLLRDVLDETTEWLRERSQKLLLERSVRFGEFTLASGKTSDFYVDVRQSALHHQGTAWLGELLFRRLSTIEGELDCRFSGVGGMTLGADPLTSATVFAAHRRETPLHGFIVRKEAKAHGLGAQVEGLDNFQSGDAVLLLEDTTTTGQSSLKAAQKAEAAGLEVRAVLTVVDRQEGAEDAVRAAGYGFYALFSRQDFKEVA